VHAALGREDAFLEYYRDNRRQQLASDLMPPTDFAGSYPAFIAQVGYCMPRQRLFPQLYTSYGTDSVTCNAPTRCLWRAVVCPGKQNVNTAALPCQVVGFFMVEDRVQRGAAGLAAGAAMDAGWELAVAALKV
jgi:hypothetical protein